MLLASFTFRFLVFIVRISSFLSFTLVYLPLSVLVSFMGRFVGARGVCCSCSGGFGDGGGGICVGVGDVGCGVGVGVGGGGGGGGGDSGGGGCCCWNSVCFSASSIMLSRIS